MKTNRNSQENNQDMKQAGERIRHGSYPVAPSPFSPDTHEEPTTDCLGKYRYIVDECVYCKRNELEMMNCPYYRQVQIYEFKEEKNKK